MTARNAHAWPESTGPAMRLVDAWKRAVARAEAQLVRLGCWFVLLDVATELGACFIPFIAPLLAIARLGALVILIPAVLRALAIRHANRSDAALLQAIAIAIGAAALYVALRTSVVVEVCSR